VERRRSGFLRFRTRRPGSEQSHPEADENTPKTTQLSGMLFSNGRRMLTLSHFRFALRVLRRNPGFAASAVGVMALGIGASTAVFSVVKGVLLTPLPFREPDRVVLVRVDVPGWTHEAALNREEFYAIRDSTDLFESVGVINQSPGSLTSPDQMEAVIAASASDAFLSTLGVRPIMGRTVTRSDVGKGGMVNAIAISYDLWERHYQRDPNVIGRPTEVNNLPVQIVGVMPKNFYLYLGPGVIAPRVDVWFGRPLSYDDSDPFRGRIVIARLKDGVTLETVRAAMTTISARLMAQYPASYSGPLRLSVTTLDQEVVSEVKPALAALSGAVAFVLLVACANLANLLLARASARTREVAVRVSIGASRQQIVAQLGAEGVLVGVLGAAGGLLLAWWCVEGLLLLAPPTLPRREVIGIDMIAALFAVAASIGCAILASLVPAWQSTRTNAAAALKKDPGSSRSAATVRGVLCAAQLALSLVLLVGAALMGRAFVSLRSVPLGFDPEHALTMTISLQGTRFNQGTLAEARAIRLEFYRQLTDAVRQLPGVEAAGVAFPTPLRGINMVQRFATSASDPERQAEAVITVGGYLEALGVSIIAGRSLTRADDTQPVVVVDERLARDAWPNQPAVGQRLALFSNIAPPRWAEVVGVAAHAQTQGLRTPGLPQIWMTYELKSYAGLDLVVRGTNPAALVGPVKDVVRRLGAGRPVGDVRLLSDRVADASGDTRFALFVLAAFAGLALVLSIVGIYAVVAYITTRRRREIAVRLALGADTPRIVSLVMRQGAVWIVAGLLAGVAGARFLTGYVSGLLFEVTSTDVVTFASVAAGLAAMALLATAVPALRASRIDPMLSLRAE
jgi:putative ABC transport system permease protein